MQNFITKILAFLNGIFHTPVLTELFIAMLPIVELRGAIPIGVESGLPIWQAALIGFAGSSIPSPVILLALIPILNALKKTKGFRRFAAWIENKFKRKSDKIQEKAAAPDMEAAADMTADLNIIPPMAVNAAAVDNNMNMNGLNIAPVPPILLNTPEESESATRRIAENEIKIKKKKERIKLLGIYTFVAIPLPFTGVWTGSAVAAFLGLNFWKALTAIVLGNLTACGIITLVTYLFKDYLWMVILILLIAVVVIIVGMIAVSLIKKARAKKSSEKRRAASEEGVASVPAEVNTVLIEIPSKNMLDDMPADIKIENTDPLIIHQKNSGEEISKTK